MRFLQPAMGITAMYLLFAQVLCSANYVSTPANSWAAGDFFHASLLKDSLDGNMGSLVDLQVKSSNELFLLLDSNIFHSAIPYSTIDANIHRNPEYWFDSLSLNYADLAMLDSAKILSLLNTPIDSEIREGIKDLTEIKSISTIRKIPDGFEKMLPEFDHIFDNQLNAIQGKKKFLNKLNVYDKEKEDLDKKISEFNNWEEVKSKVFSRSKRYILNVKKDLFAKKSMEVSKLKKEYSKVKDISDLSKSTKNKKRINSANKFWLGGNFQIIKGEPTLLDLSPLAEYAFTEKFHGGLGFSFPLEIVLSAPTVSFSGQYGYKVYFDYYLKSLYIHAETEGRQEEKFFVEGSVYKPLTYVFCIGGGKLFKITQSLNGFIQANYIINHKNSTFYPLPFNWQAGLKRRISKEK